MTVDADHHAAADSNQPAGPPPGRWYELKVARFQELAQISSRVMVRMRFAALFASAGGAQAPSFSDGRPPLDASGSRSVASAADEDIPPLFRRSSGREDRARRARGPWRFRYGENASIWPVRLSHADRLRGNNGASNPN